VGVHGRTDGGNGVVVVPGIVVYRIDIEDIVIARSIVIVRGIVIHGRIVEGGGYGATTQPQNVTDP